MRLDFGFKFNNSIIIYQHILVQETDNVFAFPEMKEFPYHENVPKVAPRFTAIAFLIF